MRNGKGRFASFLGFSFSIVIAIIFVDMFTPRGIADGVLYILPVLIMLPFGRRWAMLFATIGTLLTVSGFFTSPYSYPLLPLWFAVINRIISFVSMWSVAIFGIKFHDIMLQNRLYSDNVDTRNIRLMVAISHIDEIMTSPVWQALPKETKDLMYNIRDIIGNQAALTHGLLQLDRLRKEIEGDDH